MKKLSFPALGVLLVSLVIAVGSVSFLSPCIHEDGSYGSCHWAGQMLLGIGCLLMILAVLTLLQREHKAKAAMYLAMFCTAILGILTPGCLISLCKMNTMRCRSIMQPAMLLLCVLILLLSAAGWLLERKK